MNIKVIHVSFLMCAMLAPFSVANDSEYWSTYTLAVSVSDRVKFFAKPELRFDRNMSTFYFWKMYIGPQYRISPFFDLATFYTPKQKRGQDEWILDHLGYIDGTFTCQWLFLKISDRNRFEYNFEEEEPKYRNRVNVATPTVLAAKSVRFFLSDELFYHFDSRTINENRSSVGASLKVAAGAAVELSLMHLSKKKNEWQGTIVIVSNMKLDL